MTKTLLLLLLIVGAPLAASEKETCSTVQLLSFHNNEKNLKTLQEREYPHDCKVMAIGSSVTVRCGCYSKIDSAKQRLQELQQQYSKASLASTYKYRFGDLEMKQDTKKAEVITRKAKLSPPKQQTSCYSVQLISKSKTQKNLDRLYKENIPNSCKVMEFPKSFSIRCGCFETLQEAKSNRNTYKNYPDAQITQTYKYRFDAEYYVSRVYANNKENISAEEQELRLMLQVFLYKEDLKSAFSVASLGYSEYPNSYYWNQKMADISQWTNRSARAMKHLHKMYEIRYDPILEDKLIDYGRMNYQYESIEPLARNKAKKYPTEQNIDLLITIYKMIGLPEQVIKILDEEYERTQNPLLMRKALALSLDIGDLEQAKKYIEYFQMHKPYTKVDAALLARYYYILRDVDKSYGSLIDVSSADIIEDSNNTQELHYFELKSDLGWYLQKNLEAAKASKMLMDVDQARLVDYERIAYVYQDINTSISSEAVKKGYKEYKVSYMFFSYANDAIYKQQFKELRELLQSVDEESSPLAQEAMYWVIKSKVHGHYKEYHKEEEALKQALFLSPEDIQIRVSLLWHFMEIQDLRNTKLIALEIEESGAMTPAFYFPLASAYFYLNNIDRASFYMVELELSHANIINTVEYKFLRAYIKQIQNDENAFKSQMIELEDILSKEMKKNPALKKNNEHLSNYLRAAMYVLRADKFEKKLRKAKPYLSEKNFTELEYSWAMYIHADEKSHKIFNTAKYKELWMQFSNAIVFQNHSNIEDFIFQYLHLLSQGDISTSANQDGQVALAQKVAYDILDKNEYNQNAYIAHLDLSQQRSDMFNTRLSYNQREPLLQKSLEINNRNYLGKDTYLLSGLHSYKNSSTDAKNLINVPSTTYKLNLGIDKKFDKSNLQFSLRYNHALKNYFSYIIDGEYQISNDFRVGAELAYNKETQESTQLYLGGKKHLIAPRIKYQLLSSTTLDLLYEHSKFYAQDELYLGSGEYFRGTLSQQIRNGYPDLMLSMFYDRGSYSETSGSRGIIDTILVQDSKVLPNPFYNIGVSFSYGMANSNYYTRVWRPYFEVFPYYNSDLGDYTYGFNAGLGGKVFHQDHLSIGTSYAESLNGVGGKLFELYLNYQFNYTLSKGH